MAIIVKKRIYWTPVVAADLVGYRVRVAKAGISFSKDLPYVSIGTTVAGDGKMELIAPDGFPAGTFQEDTDYQIWISSVDRGGNEANPFLLVSYLDFVPPPPVTDGGLSDFPS